MAVSIRMKRFGRHRRPFFRVCAIDSKRGRDGRVIEELGHYDPLVREVDARAVLNGERVAYWVSVGAQPSERVSVLIKKYGKDGTHLAAQQAALERLRVNKPKAPPPMKVPPKKVEEPAAPEAAATEGGAEAPAGEGG